MFWKIVCFFAILGSSLIEAKVTIFAHYFGKPEFVKYQYLFFKRNLLDEYEFVIFEDSNNPNISEQIKKECEKYDIKYVHIPSSVFENPKMVPASYTDINNPSFQCSVATQYIYDHYVVPSKDICLILDNDIFLLSPFSIEKYLGASSFSYSRQERKGSGLLVFYMLPNFVIFNPSIMPEKEQLDFNLGTILENHTDSGGFTYFYLLDYASLGSEMPQYYLYNTHSDLKHCFGDQFPLLFNSSEWSSHFFLEKDAFLHIRMGSNWSQHSKYPQMMQEVEAFFESLLNR